MLLVQRTDEVLIGRAAGSLIGRAAGSLSRAASPLDARYFAHNSPNAPNDGAVQRTADAMAALDYGSA